MDEDRTFVTARTLWTLVERRAEATPDALMAVDERGQRQTFAEYHAAAAVAAAGLLAQGVAPGSVVAWQLPTWIEALVLAGALARLDCTQVPLLPIYRGREIAHAVHTTAATTVVVPRQFRGLDLAAQARRAVPTGARLLVIDDRTLAPGDPGTLPEAGPSPAPGEPVRWVFHTSGTTDAPKGVRHTDGALLAAARAFIHSARITAADRSALVFPVTHIGGIQLLFLVLDVGAANILLEHFEPDAAVEILDREGVTLAGAGPAFFLGYLDVQRRHPERPVLPTARLFPSGGAPKSRALHEAMRETFGIGILSNYGMTECPNITGNLPDEPDEKLADTEGLANPGVELRVLAPDGSVCDAGQAGELWVRGPQMCVGYVDRTLDATAFDDDGFVRTGDLAIVDADGYVQIVGRLKDVIIRKGENISAREVEMLLEAHPAIAEVAVVGLPDDRTGERCCAVVVAAGPANAPTLAELSAFLRERGLMVQKVPEQLEVVDHLPRNASGKVDKQVLRDQLEASS